MKTPRPRPPGAVTRIAPKAGHSAAPLPAAGPRRVAAPKKNAPGWPGAASARRPAVLPPGRRKLGQGPAPVFREARRFLQIFSALLFGRPALVGGRYRHPPRAALRPVAHPKPRRRCRRRQIFLHRARLRERPARVALRRAGGPGRSSPPTAEALVAAAYETAEPRPDSNPSCREHTLDERLLKTLKQEDYERAARLRDALDRCKRLGQTPWRAGPWGPARR